MLGYRHNCGGCDIGHRLVAVRLGVRPVVTTGCTRVPGWVAGVGFGVEGAGWGLRV